MEKKEWRVQDGQVNLEKEGREEPVEDVDYLLQQELCCFHEAVTKFNEVPVKPMFNNYRPNKSFHFVLIPKKYYRLDC